MPDANTRAGRPNRVDAPEHVDRNGPPSPCIYPRGAMPSQLRTGPQGTVSPPTSRHLLLRPQAALPVAKVSLRPRPGH